MNKVTESENRPSAETIEKSVDGLFIFFAFNSLPLPLSIIRYSNNQFITANDAFVKFCGFSKDELVGCTSFELGLWTDLEDHELIIQTPFPQGEVKDFPVKYKKKSGKTGHISCVVSFVELDGEQFLFSMLNKLTQTNRDPRLLPIKDMSHRALNDHMLNGMAYCKMLFDDAQPIDFIYLYTNPAFTELTGLVDVEGKRVTEIIPGILESDQYLFEIYGRVAKGGPPEKFELYLKSFQMWFAVSVYCPKPEHFVALFDIITERKVAEQALQESNNRLALAQRSASAGIWDWDLVANKLFWTDEFYTLFDLDPETTEASFNSWRIRVHPDDLRMAENHIYAAILNHSPLVNNYRIILANGCVRWIDAKGDVIYDEHNTPMRMTGVCLDVTERKKIELAQRYSELRYHTLIDQAAPDAIFVHDEQGRFLEANQHASFITGYSQEELLTMNMHDLRSGRDPLAKIIDWHCINPGTSTTSWDQYLRKDGSISSVEVRYGLHVYEDKRFYICFVRDITTRLQAEESARQAELVFQNSSEGIIITDAKRTILAVNPAFTEISGYSLEEVIGKKPTLLNSGVHDHAFFDAMWHSIASTGKWQGEIWSRRKNGEIFPEQLFVNTIFNKDGTVYRYFGMSRDITKQKKDEDLIWYQANYDPLTNLPNRRLFHEKLNFEIKHAYNNNLKIAILYLDLDRFKEVNDTLGHDLGDLLLQEAGRRISNCIRETDTLARLGGDEFIIVMPDLSDTASIDRVANCLLGKLSERFQLGDEIAYVSGSIGITLYPQDGEQIETLLKNADHAMYSAKHLGRNRASYFSKQMPEAAKRRMQISNDLREALEKQQFQVYYQPILELATGAIYKAEALIRWHHPVFGMISPAEFIPIAEETGQIVPIGDWVFKQSIQQAMHWRHSIPSFQVSVNKSPVQFRENSNNLDWIGYLREAGLPGNSIVVEITEGLLADSSINVQLLLFRDAGIQVSLDDFGTGYSSLSYLKRFDIDHLKIDQSFVKNLAPDSDDMALCEAIIVMAHKLGMKVIAEGVETSDQHKLLLAAGCDYGQGYLWSKPIPALEFEKFFIAR